MIKRHAVFNLSKDEKKLMDNYLMNLHMFFPATKYTLNNDNYTAYNYMRRLEFDLQKAAMKMENEVGGEKFFDAECERVKKRLQRVLGIDHTKIAFDSDSRGNVLKVKEGVYPTWPYRDYGGQQVLYYDVLEYGSSVTNLD